MSVNELIYRLVLKKSPVIELDASEKLVRILRIKKVCTDRGVLIDRAVIETAIERILRNNKSDDGWYLLDSLDDASIFKIILHACDVIIVSGENTIPVPDELKKVVEQEREAYWKLFNYSQNPKDIVNSLELESEFWNRENYVEAASNGSLDTQPTRLFNEA